MDLYKNENNTIFYDQFSIGDKLIKINNKVCPFIELDKNIILIDIHEKYMNITKKVIFLMTNLQLILIIYTHNKMSVNFVIIKKLFVYKKDDHMELYYIKLNYNIFSFNMIHKINIFGIK